MYVHKAYFSAKGGSAILNLTHDVKRAMAESGLESGLVTVLSSQGTTAVILLESDAELQKEYQTYVNGLFESSSKEVTSRRSGTGANCFHHRAAFVGLSITLSFEQGRLLSSPFQDVCGIDFEPKPGRREFVISVLGDGK